jgi:hypothetical protein
MQASHHMGTAIMLPIRFALASGAVAAGAAVYR